MKVALLKTHQKSHPTQTCQSSGEENRAQENSMFRGFPQSSVGKESACSVGDPGLIPGSGRSHGEGNGSPFQYSCLENPMDRRTWQATVHGITRVRHDLVTKSPNNKSLKNKNQNGFYFFTVSTQRSNTTYKML